MKFTLYCEDKNKELKKLYYDNMSGLLFDSNGVSLGNGNHYNQTKLQIEYATNQEKFPIKKGNTPDVIKIQLGLSCNYECNYCLQRFVPRADEKSKALLPSFMDKLKKNIKTKPKKIELWGGEPLVYIKTVMPLVEELRTMWGYDVEISMITNGSLLSDPLVDWIMKEDIVIAISHDGPGQDIRGEDPFKHILAGPAIKRLYKEKKEAGKPFSFNAMVHAQNPDREAIQQWFIDKIGDPDVAIGEGAVIEVYDEGAKENSLVTKEDQLNIRKLSYEQLINQKVNNFGITYQRLDEWFSTMTNGRNLLSLGMKCSMDKESHITVDLSGNVLTCQNVSEVATAPNGQSHCGGTIDDLSKVSITTSKHFTARDHCVNCPVVQQCKGGCMYLDGDLFYASCNNTYSDYISYFAAAIYFLTDGLKLVYIEDEEGKLPKERMNVFGLVEELENAEAIV